MVKNTFLCGPVPDCHAQAVTRNLSLLSLRTVSARQGPVPGQVVSYIARTSTPHFALATLIFL